MAVAISVITVIKTISTARSTIAAVTRGTIVEALLSAIVKAFFSAIVKAFFSTIVKALFSATMVLFNAIAREFRLRNLLGSLCLLFGLSDLHSNCCFPYFMIVEFRDCLLRQLRVFVPDQSFSLRLVYFRDSLCVVEHVAAGQSSELSKKFAQLLVCDRGRQIPDFEQSTGKFGRRVRLDRLLDRF